MSERMSEKNLHWFESNPSRITEGEALLIIKELINLREVTPELLAAGKKVIAYDAQLQYLGNPQWQELKRTMVNAIAKAEGRE